MNILKQSQTPRLRARAQKTINSVRGQFYDVTNCRFGSVRYTTAASRTWGL